jgi:iron-only hydrogenase group A
MGIRLEVNGRSMEAEKGETILSALNRHGIHVPTICSMKGLSPSGACRMGVVEVEGRENLVPSCSFSVEESMKIRTHSPRVLRARKTNVELLLSNHPDDCLYCERNGSCELQTFSEEMNIRERRIPGNRKTRETDHSSPAMVREPSKCILCGRCVRVCEEVMHTSTLDFAHRGSELRISTMLDVSLNDSNCTSCGQCLMSCPTGALTEKVDFPALEPHLHDPGKLVVAQYSPAVAVSVGELLGFKPGTDLSGTIHAVLRRIGFDFVFESSLGAELMIMEQARLFMDRMEDSRTLPLITSSCPAWIHYAEQYYPELFSYLSPLKSPQQITGGLIRDLLSKEEHDTGKTVVSVLIASCTAAKTEAGRMHSAHTGAPVIDLVLTTRELARMIRLSGLELDMLETEPPDEPFRSADIAGNLSSVSGGEAEATARAIFALKSGSTMPPSKLHRFRGHKPFREVGLKMGETSVRIGIVSGLANAVKLIEELRAGKKRLDYLEVMACPGGCINGGGQPIPAMELSIRARAKAVFDRESRGHPETAPDIRSARDFYGESLGEPGGERARELMYTRFTQRENQ